MFENEFEGFGRDTIRREGDGGELGTPMAALGGISETDDGKIGGAGASEVARGIHRAKSDAIVDAEERRHVGTTLHELSESATATFEAELNNVLDAVFHVGKFGAFKGAPVTGKFAQGSLRPSFEVADEANVAVAKLDQMASGAEAGVLTIGG
jgi:hypothetical protein